MSKTITEWVKEVHEVAKSKGWYDPDLQPATTLERHMLIVSEVSEATEEARIGSPVIHFGELNPPMPGELADARGVCTGVRNGKQYVLRAHEGLQRMKPEGELIELADAVIRIMDYCGSRNWDLEGAINVKNEYNKTRPHRHGNKLK